MLNCVTGISQVLATSPLFLISSSFSKSQKFDAEIVLLEKKSLMIFFSVFPVISYLTDTNISVKIPFSFVKDY